MHCYRSVIDQERYRANGELRYYGGRLWRFDEPGDLADAPSFGEQESTHHGSSWTDGKNVTGREANANCLKSGRVPSVLYEAFLEARRGVDPVVEEAGRIGNTTKRRRHYSDQGDEVNIDRLLTGDPNFWERRKRGKKQRVVRIGISYADHWAARERDYVARAAAAAATVDALTVMGFGTEVWGYSTGRVSDGNMEHGHEWTTAVRLKASDQPLDVQKILVTGLTAMSRRFTFGIYEAEGGGPHWNSNCDGLSKTMKAELDLDVVLGDEASPDFDPELVALIERMRKGAQEGAQDAKWTDEARGEAEGFAQGLEALEGLEAGAQEAGEGENEGEGEGEEEGEGEGEGLEAEGLEGEGGFSPDQDGMDLGPDVGPDGPPQPRHSHQKDEQIDWAAHGFGWAGIY